MGKIYDHLDLLESESIHILRETKEQFKNPVLLFSCGKDSIVLTRLIQKAFYPFGFPFKMLHVDTGHNFPEVIKFRDNVVKKLQTTIKVELVENTINEKKIIEKRDINYSRNTLQSITLLDAIKHLRIDACIGGARRDEEKARAKEKIFSIRDGLGKWDLNKQRPELWNTYNGMINKGENVRVFPISNWTELDIWNYIKREKIEIPNIYFTHKRNCIIRNGQILSDSEFIVKDENDIIEERQVRFRTVGDMTCTAAVESNASTIDEIIKEIEDSEISERGARMDDKTSQSAMEDRKNNGYF